MGKVCKLNLAFGIETIAYLQTLEGCGFSFRDDPLQALA